MNKFFGLFLLALAFLPSGAEAANRFWVGGAGTWDSTSTTHWSATSGGANGASAPTTGDVVTFDASSGGGTVTVDSTVSGLSLLNLVAGAFTGTLDFSVNNPNMTITGTLNLSGTGARKFLMGSGTFTFSATTSTTIFDLTTTTNLDGTSVFTANYTITGNATADRTFVGAGKTFGTLTLSSNTSRGQLVITGANTFAAVSLASGSVVALSAGATNTITAAPTWTGSSSNPIFIRTSAPNSGVATISVGAGTVSCDWCGLYGLTGTGGATFTATNSLDLGRNTGITITVPSGGGGGGRIIGG